MSEGIHLWGWGMYHFFGLLSLLFPVLIVEVSGLKSSVLPIYVDFPSKLDYCTGKPLFGIAWTILVAETGSPIQAATFRSQRTKNTVEDWQELACSPCLCFQETLFHFVHMELHPVYSWMQIMDSLACKYVVHEFLTAGSWQMCTALNRCSKLVTY